MKQLRSPEPQQTPRGGVRLKIDGLDVTVDAGTSVLEAARFLGLEIPTLCHVDGLSAYGGCRLCVVEIGKGDKARLVSSCTYPAEDGLVARTNTKRVVRTRKMLIELLVSIAPSSKVIQDLAARFGVQKCRFKPKYEDCILCGLCVRMCQEQMMSGAIDFVGRGQKRRITTPFDKKSELCRTCGGCMYICPVCTLRCQGPSAPTDVCGSCVCMEPTCIEKFDDYMCYLGPTGVCGTCVSEGKKVEGSGGDKELCHTANTTQQRQP
ncbi:MAG: (2Fe-2S)-binding protein [Elusimicrobia bacterium]|nr:(2Fe-2S)-binding protein [Elusimicrobiota bacterium]